MAYIPKSKVNVSDTHGGEFVIKSTNQDYIGKYIELSNGKYYAGSNPSQLGPELTIPISRNQLGNSKDAFIYSILKPKRTKFQSEIKLIHPTKTTPTEKDYSRGHYTRYFAKKVNEPRGYMEIDIDTFNSIIQQKKEYDFYLYEVGSLIWNLKNGTTNSNLKILQILERNFPFVSIIFPILNEFEKIDSILTTHGGELYYEDGREYTGPYHIHEDTPMVGPIHTEEPHATLYYSKDLQDQNQSIKDFMNQNLFEIQMQQKDEAPDEYQDASATPQKSSTEGGGY